MKEILRISAFVLMLTLMLITVTSCDFPGSIDTIKDKFQAIINPACEHIGGAATCTEQAICEKCGESYGELASHTLVDVEALEATCTTDGYTAHKACSCGYTEGKEVISASHTLVDVEALEATCTTDGYTAHKVCSCGYTEGKELISASGHTDTDANLQCEVCSLYLLPEVGTAFHLSLYQTNLGKTLYFAGRMNGYYYATTEKLCEATDLYLEETEGGHYIYFMSDETKNYLYIQISGTYTNVKYGSTQDVWTFDEVLGVFVNDVDGTDYYIGTYKTFNTISASKLSYISGDKASTIGVSNFPTRILVDNHTCSYSEATCKVLATCSICGVTTGELAAHNSDVVVDAIDATCTSAGATAGTKCSVCGTVTSGCEAIEMLSHTYVNGVCACSAVCPHTDVAAGETCGVCGVTLPTEAEGGDVEVITATATLTPNVTANMNSFASGDDITSYTSLADSEIFTLTVGDKTNNNNQVYVSTSGEIRLYSDSNDNLGNTLTITSTKKIVSIAITYSGTSRSGATFTIGDSTVAGGTGITEETITVNANSVTIANNKASGQIRITSIVITYEE